MVDLIDVQPIWNRGIFFKVYEMKKQLGYSDLHNSIKKYSGDWVSRKEGWLVEYPYFKINNNKFVSFLYLSFRKNSKASELEGKKILEPEYVGSAFDFDENIIIVSTTSNTKLNSLVENAFEPITNLCEVNDYRYSGDFLFWLAYMNDIKNGIINQNISISRITAISSERDKWNLSEAVSCQDDITNIVEAKIILGINKYANLARMQINSNGNTFDLSLTSDGRIRAKQGVNINSKDEKATYAKNIHKTIQEIYEEYKKDVSNTNWEQIKDAYSKDLIQCGIDELNRLLTTP